MGDAFEPLRLPRVAIIGAGVSGLLLAQGLQKNGFDVTVYERESYPGEKMREWTMLLHWALPIVQNILPPHVFDNLRSAYTDPHYAYEKAKEVIPYYNGQTGKLAFSVSDAVRRVSRTRLRQVCSKGIDIRWGKQLKTLELDLTPDGDATLVFDDGEAVKVDLVIGADGSHSAVRQWLLGAEASKPSDSGKVIGSGIFKYDTGAQAKIIRMDHPICVIAPTADGAIFSAVQNVPDPKDPANWTFHVAKVWKDNVDLLVGQEAIAKTKALTGPDVSEPFRSAIEWIPDNANFFISQLRYWVTVPWDNRRGRVALVGDAAHCLLPGRGQGLNHAVKDVDQLISQLVEAKEMRKTFQEALNAYEADVFVRGRKAVLESVEDTETITKAKTMEKSRPANQGFALSA
ncbi:putative monooxygenase [Podospora didyma]|uniref:Monooxygenase n=1 Tax=Podospora didyma TaxID=330526 RepID=A0AAE0NY59_9PEZI|nr:putative monooxygenase [Podospora didyma]